MQIPSFIPSYPASRAFTEMRDATSPVLHLVHPHPVSWRTLIAPIAKDLGVPLVSYPEWFKALEGCVEEGTMEEVDAMRGNPALRLLDFFRAPASGDRPAVLPSTEKAEKVSGTLRNLPPLGEGDSKRWMAAWRASGFL